MSGINGAGTSLEAEQDCPPDYRQPARLLTPEQLSKPITDVYAARLRPGQDPQALELFTGKYAQIRTRLDYTYHKVPTKARQLLQDSIIDDVLEMRTEECQDCVEPEEDRAHPQVLFTAGAMAAGKSHTLKDFLLNGTVRLPRDFIWIDPDNIARMLPEKEQYLAFDKDTAPEMIHPEAAMLQEILGMIAREERRSTVIDGSLSCGEWFEQLMKTYRDEGYRVEIFFVFADLKVMFQRAKQREKETGRQTDEDKIEMTARRTPESVRRLAVKSNVDRVRIVDNSSNTLPPKVVYDSVEDPAFESGGEHVDVQRFVRHEAT